MSIDSELTWFTTYSQDERIEREIQEERQSELENFRLYQARREEIFMSIFEDKDSTIFQFPELSFPKFTHEKIRFVFDPSKVIKCVSQKTIFRCSLEYFRTYRRWHVKSDSFPVTHKQKIYRMFYDRDYFTISDTKLLEVILKIRDVLLDWANEEEKFRVDKFRRYQTGEIEYIHLDTDDEELFLSYEQKIELLGKRNTVLKRMIPPKRTRQIKRRRRIVEPSLDSD